MPKIIWSFGQYRIVLGDSKQLTVEKQTHDAMDRESWRLVAATNRSYNNEVETFSALLALAKSMHENQRQKT